MLFDIRSLWKNENMTCYVKNWIQSAYSSPKEMLIRIKDILKICVFTDLMQINRTIFWGSQSFKNWWSEIVRKYVFVSLAVFVVGSTIQHHPNSPLMYRKRYQRQHSITTYSRFSVEHFWQNRCWTPCIIYTFYNQPFTIF